MQRYKENPTPAIANVRFLYLYYLYLNRFTSLIGCI
nr:MAG TPA: hypothetical protein [Caudoviricetes sp.]